MLLGDDEQALAKVLERARLRPAICGELVQEHEPHPTPAGARCTGVPLVDPPEPRPAPPAGRQPDECDVIECMDCPPV